MNKKLVSRAVDAYLDTLQGSDAVRFRFFEGLWDVQCSVDVPDLSYEPIGSRAVAETLGAGRTIFEVNPPEIPLQGYREALSRVAGYVVEMAGLSARQAQALAAVDFEALIDADRLAIAASAPTGFIAVVQEDLGVTGQTDLTSTTLAFVLASALTPFLEGPASRSMSALEADAREAGRSPVCPVCGSTATLAQVGETGSALGAGRTLWCGLCHTEWEYDRIRCSRCGNRSQKSLHYLHVEGDDAHRLHVCDDCNGYIRTVFQANTNKPISFQVEDVAMAGLDALALSRTHHE